MKNKLAGWVGLTCSLAALIAPNHSGAADAVPPLKVMSFNIRYGLAKDGTNNWPLRRQLVLQTIKAMDPDLLGLQEALDFQVAFLRQHLPDYGFHGVGREDGAARGEFVPVMFKRARFTVKYSGFFWLSETPEVPGSKSWDAALTRMLSWVALADHQAADRSFVFANVHFDHRGRAARLQSARLIQERAVDIKDEYPAILCGDFNSTEDSPPYAELVRGTGADRLQFIDSFRAVHPARTPNEATFHGWKATRAGSRIDWILHTPEFTTRRAWIDYTQDAGRYPSDHYPVCAVLVLK